jgi:hypothetical protein
MGIRTTVTLDEDVLERVKQESRSRGVPFRQTLNDLLRKSFTQVEPIRRNFKVEPFLKGFEQGLNYDCTSALLEYLDGPEHR